MSKSLEDGRKLTTLDGGLETVFRIRFLFSVHLLGHVSHENHDLAPPSAQGCVSNTGNPTG